MTGAILAVPSGGAVLVLLVLLLVPQLQAVNRPMAFLACGISYIALPLAPLGLGLLLLAKGRWRLLAAGVLVVSLVVGSSPWWRFPTSTTPVPTSDDLHVVSLNAEFGQADLDTVMTLSRTADLMAFQENTPEFVSSLEQRGLLTDFPYRVGTAAYEAYGTMLWSRTPLTQVASGATRFTSVVARTTVRGTSWTVATAHAVSPLDGSRSWAADASAVADLLRPYVSEQLVVVGDFNAVDDHLTMRRIRAVGLADAMDGWPQRSGDGWQLSWPNDDRAPFLIRIDHALHSASVSAWRPTYVTVAHTDHRALVAVFRAS